LNAEAQEARFKENTNWKKSGEEAEENAIGWFFDRCSRSGSSPLKMVYFFSGVNRPKRPSWRRSRRDKRSIPFYLQPAAVKPQGQVFILHKMVPGKVEMVLIVEIGRSGI
jgi:hypothetical protein